MLKIDIDVVLFEQVGRFCFGLSFVVGLWVCIFLQNVGQKYRRKHTSRLLGGGGLGDKKEVHVWR